MLTIIDQGMISHRPNIGAYMPSITSPCRTAGSLASQHVGEELAPRITISEVPPLAGRAGNGENRGSIHTPDQNLDNWC